MGDIQDWTKIAGTYRRRAEQQKTEIRFYRAVIVGLLIVVTILTGCTQQTNGALIWAIGDAVSETGIR